MPVIRLLDISFDAPAQNLALDEVLLDAVERGHAPDTLRFWESPISFVALGTVQALAQEVARTHCEEDGIPILRRCTAGGCVLQGPGCLNFSLALSIERVPEAKGLHPSYAYVLGRISDALTHRGVPVYREGICDLVLDTRKVSGNAQRRRRRAILHHGTLLYRPDLEGMERYLREPEKRPSYRGARTHREFVGALPLEPGALRAAVCEAFRVAGPPEAPTAGEWQATRELAQSKYHSQQWTHRR